MHSAVLRPARQWALRVAALACALLVGSGAGLQAQGFGKNKIRYEDFDWRIYHSTHFDIYYYSESESQLQKVASLAESAYDQLSLDLDYQIQEPTPLIIYNTHSDFLQNNVMINFIPEGVAAFATSARFRMVMPVDLPDIELYELLLHELTHIFQYHILFGGSLGRALTSSPPQWLMEGMASYFAKDESAADRMYLRDAVVNDRLPPITSGQAGGFFAYRYGHAAFDFMEERWGADGVIDFLFEFRNTIGARVGRAIERAFRIDPDDFDLEFRRWLRNQYLPELVATGEPSDFGRPFRTRPQGSQETSPVASPSGDLVAAFSTYQDDIDIVLFDTQEREPVRNLTKGYTSEFRHYVAQMLSLGRKHGRDLAFSPDGNSLAAFVRKEAGYSLAIVNVIGGGVRRVIDMEIEQQTAPSWSPDGRSVAFGGNQNGQYDIFELDLESLEIRNLTNDEVFDGAPSYSHDGEWLVFSSVPGETGQLFRLNLETMERTRVSSDEHHNTDAVFSGDDGTVYFTSDRSGAENIFGLDLDTGELRQYTNAITGCFQPTVLTTAGSDDRLVYTGFWKGRFDLYERNIDEPIGEVQVVDVGIGGDPIPAIDIFEPDIQVSIDESNKEDKRGWRLFLEDAQTAIGVDDNQTFLGQVYLQFSDFLGDRRLFTTFASVESFSQFNVTYLNLSNRLQWQVSLFDDRAFYVGYDYRYGYYERGRSLFQQTGAIFSISYPMSFYRRFELGAGYIRRKIDLQAYARDSDFRLLLDDFGRPIPVINPREDDYPVIQTALVGDTTVFGPAGPSSGHRYRLSAEYAPDLETSGVLTQTIQLDARKYFPLTRRSVFATRIFGSMRTGNFPNPVYFGGLDTVRGVDFRDMVGDHGFFTNLELRFPLIDFFVTPIWTFQGIQGRFFIDIAGAYFDGIQRFDIWDSENSRLDDAIAAYGFGITVRMLGVDLHWDFATQWDLKESGDSRTTFWIGQRF